MSSCHRNSIILGDFNVHFTSMELFQPQCSRLHAMENLIDTTQLIHLQSAPIFLYFGTSISRPDLCLVNASLMNRSELKLMDAVKGYGHSALFLGMRPKSNNVQKSCLPHWNSKKANWTAFKKTSNQLLIPGIIAS